MVAELVPPRPSRSADLADALLADMVRRGVITPALLPPGPPPPVPPRTAKLAEILAELDRDRDDR